MGRKSIEDKLVQIPIHIRQSDIEDITKQKYNLEAKRKFEKWIKNILKQVYPKLKP